MRRIVWLLLLAATGATAQTQQAPTFTSTRNWVTEYLANGGDVANVTGLKRPENWREGATFVNLKPLADLPATYDWNTQIAGGMQPIQNQGSCGSCWAFSITAVVESLLRIKEPNMTPNVSEQTLVDCSDYDCGGGYFDAFDYVQTKGLANRVDYPYRASSNRCHVTDAMQKQKVVSWAYVGSKDTTPTTEQIKTAIMTYGPVSVDVAVQGGFSGYDSGVYDDCSQGGINHMVTIEGWNDADGGYWIMRNSWGTDWGEHGYMRIRYTDSRGNKCNEIGDSTAFAVLN